MNEPLKQPMNDGVLTATRWKINVIIGIMMFAAVTVSIGLIALPIFSGEVTREVGENFINPDAYGLLPMLMIILAGVIGVLTLAITFLFQLTKIINSAGEGDPFVRINAKRLRMMAYVTLAIQGVLVVLTITFSVLQGKLGELKPDSELTLQSDLDVSLTGILMFFILIILARIFERGADMREELEGTV